MTDNPSHAERLFPAAYQRAKAAGATDEQIEAALRPPQFTGSSTSVVSQQMGVIITEIAAARAGRVWNRDHSGWASFSFRWQLQTTIGDRGEISRDDLIQAAAMICAEIEGRDQAAARKEHTR